MLLSLRYFSFQRLIFFQVGVYLTVFGSVERVHEVFAAQVRHVGSLSRRNAGYQPNHHQCNYEYSFHLSVFSLLGSGLLVISPMPRPLLPQAQW